MSTAFIPPFVLQRIAKEAVGTVACGPTAGEDVPLDAIKAAAEAQGLLVEGKAKGVEPITVVSEVFRHHANGRLLFTVEHMGRYARKLETTFGVSAGDSAVCGASFNAVARLADLAKKDAAKDGATNINGTNLCLLSWPVSQKKGVAMVCTLAYYIKTEGFSEDAATNGAFVSVVFTEGDAAKAMAADHKANLGVTETLFVNKDGVVYDGANGHFFCVGEGAAVVPLDYTPATNDDEAVLNMSVSLLGLKSTCDRLGIEFRTLDVSIGHLAFADCVALVSDDHDICPVSAFIISAEDKARINPAFMPAFVEKDGWLVLKKVITPVHTGVVDKLNTYITQKGYQWGDDLGAACAQQ